MSKFLFEVQQKNRLSQKGLLKRFSITCYGHQESLEEMRAAKAAKYKELKQTQNTAEYNEWFLNYKPSSGKTSTVGSDLTNPKIIQKGKPIKRGRKTKKRKNDSKYKTKTNKNMLKLIYGRNIKNKSL
jgi:hypothetical protein